MSLTRRNFLTYLGMGSYALMRDTVMAQQQPPAKFPLRTPKPAQGLGFNPIPFDGSDNLKLPEGYHFDMVCKWGDALGTNGAHGKETFGFNCDLNVYFPMDALTGGKSSTEGLLWTNHEYPNPLFVSNYTDTNLPKTEAQIVQEKLCVGGSIIHIKQENGVWKHLPGSKYTKRFTALYPKFTVTGPVKETLGEMVGTLANCSGGITPWNTVLSCEENYDDYNVGYRWRDIPSQQIDIRHFGWVIEVDPFGELPPMKHTCLGRFAHENTAWRIGGSGKLVIYMGDDAQDQYLYKFVSAAPYRENASRADKRKLLTEGTLYVAEFNRGVWIPMDYDKSDILQAAEFKDDEGDTRKFRGQGDVLMHSRQAARILKATPIDRPEDCEVHPHDGSLFVALTNNALHGNVYGQIIRLVELNDDAESIEFQYEIFLAGGPQSGLASPDNLAFDKKGNLWVACDISSSSIGAGANVFFGNNGFFVVPTVGDNIGDAYQFASGPTESELTGPWFTPDEKTLFLSVQHPGEGTRDMDSMSSRWPHGKNDAPPQPCVVAIRGFK